MTFIELLAEMCEGYIAKELTEGTEKDESTDTRNNENDIFQSTVTPATVKVKKWQFMLVYQQRNKRKKVIQ